MTPYIPPVISLAKERAESFQRRVKILYAHIGGDTPHFHALNETWILVEDLMWEEGRRSPLTSPLVQVEWALEWAHSSSPPPIDALREARAALQSAATAWMEAITMLREMLNRRLDIYKPRWPDWLFEIERAAATEKRRIDRLLDESWPVDTAEDEKRLLAEMQRGTLVDVDDAFAHIAGVSKEELEKRFQAHKAKHGR